MPPLYIIQGERQLPVLQQPQGNFTFGHGWRDPFQNSTVLSNVLKLKTSQKACVKKRPYYHDFCRKILTATSIKSRTLILTSFLWTSQSEGLWKTMLRLGCPEKLITLICEFYYDINACMHGICKSSNAFPVTKWVKQGSVSASRQYFSYAYWCLQTKFRESEREHWSTTKRLKAIQPTLLQSTIEVKQTPACTWLCPKFHNWSEDANQHWQAV